VKRKISIILLAALLLAALAAVVCEKPEFDNPLDKKGDNYLFGNKEDEEGKMKTDENGVADLYADPNNQYRPKCDLRTPEITLDGAGKATLVETDTVGFKKLMHIGVAGWDGLIRWDAEKYPEASPLEPRLTLGGSTNLPSVMPAPGANYVIIYRIENPTCNGDKKGDEVHRQLTVEKYVPPADTTSPKINLQGDSYVEVVQGDKYSDQGVIVMWGTNDITATGLDSIVVTGSGSYHKAVSRPGAVFSGVEVPTTNLGYSYRIDYYATAPNGKKATARRSVLIIERQTVGQPKAVIVLNPYKHVVNGKTIEHPDTMAFFRGTYTEKGVKRAFYVKDGKEEDIPLTAGKVTIGAAPNLNTDSPRSIPVKYELKEGGSGYVAADAINRYVYAVDDGCEKPDPKPEVVFSAGDVSITAGTPWTTYNSGWSVTARDTVDIEQGIRYPDGFPYIIDFDGGKLDPRNPKAGTYTLTYVGLSKCGVLTAPKTRAVTVR
jgi:hypothetical protein